MRAGEPMRWERVSISVFGEHLEQLAGKSDPNEDALEFERLSKLARGDSRGWKFDREELVSDHEAAFDASKPTRAASLSVG